MSRFTVFENPKSPKKKRIRLDFGIITTEKDGCVTDIHRTMRPDVIVADHDISGTSWNHQIQNCDLMSTFPVEHDCTNESGKLFGSKNIDDSRKSSLSSQSTSSHASSGSMKGRTQLQLNSCMEMESKLEKCRDCYYTSRGSAVETLQCRFKGFRKHCVMPESGEPHVDFPDPLADISEENLWLWLASCDRLPKNLTIQTSLYILAHVLNPYKSFMEAEIKALAVKKVPRINSSVVWKPLLEENRDTCDVCSTSLFNFHLTCKHCGFACCLDCYTCKPSKTIKGHSSGTGCWLTCTKRRPHKDSSLMLTQVIPDRCVDILSGQLHDLCHVYKIPQVCDCWDTSFLSENERSGISVSPECSKHATKGTEMEIGYGCLDACGKRCKRCTEVCEKGQILILEYPTTELSVDIFQCKWKLGEPVVVRNVHTGLEAGIWSPDSFAADIVDDNTEFEDCSTGETIPGVTWNQFWDGFVNVKNRLTDTEGKQVLLKVKDWPTTNDFATECPARFADLMANIPLPLYTSRTGLMNLASRLPTIYIQPDLGPKLYIAYGSGSKFKDGTTNLHLDMADAANVLVHVGVADDDQDTIKCIKESIAKSGAEDRDVQSALEDLGNVGAIWHIYNAKDSIRIREMLSKMFPDALGADQDPIHDQSVYLDASLRQTLKEEYEVSGYCIIQRLGDMVFIPAGAPHQVKNLNSCIKIALDFVSPEHVDQCLKLSEEFRHLSVYHTNHEDKLQIKNIMFHSIKDAASVLMSSPTSADNSLTNDSLNSVVAIAGDSDMCYSDDDFQSGCETQCIQEFRDDFFEWDETPTCSSRTRIFPHPPSPDMLNSPTLEQENEDNEASILQVGNGSDSIDNCNDKVDEDTSASSEVPPIEMFGNCSNKNKNNENNDSDESWHPSESEHDNAVESDDSIVVISKLHKTPRRCSSNRNVPASQEEPNSEVSCVVNEKLRPVTLLGNEATVCTDKGKIRCAIRQRGGSSNIKTTGDKHLSRDAKLVDKIAERNKKQKKREYDKQRHLDKKQKSEETNKKRMDPQLKTWLDRLEKKGRLRTNPNERIPYPPIINDIDNIRLYSKKELNAWIKSHRNWCLEIAEPKDWKFRTPGRTFLYKNNHYNVCPYCDKHPDIAVPNENVLQTAWCKHVKEHSPLPCYDLNCSNTYPDEHRRTRHMKTHFKKKWNRTIPDGDDETT